MPIKVGDEVLVKGKVTAIIHREKGEVVFKVDFEKADLFFRSTVVPESELTHAGRAAA